MREIFIDVEYPLTSEDKDSTSEELRRMAAKEIEKWRGLNEEVNQMIQDQNKEHRKLQDLGRRTQRLVSSAEIFLEMLMNLAEELEDE